MELLANPYTPKPGDVSGSSFLQLDAPSIDGVYTIELEIRKPPFLGKGYPLFWLWIGDTPGRGWRNTPAYVVYRGGKLRLTSKIQGKDGTLDERQHKPSDLSKLIVRVDTRQQLVLLVVNPHGGRLFTEWPAMPPETRAHIWLGGVGKGEQLAEHVTWKSVRWEPLGQVEPIPEDPSDGAEIMRIARRMMADAATLMLIGERLGGGRE